MAVEYEFDDHLRYVDGTDDSTFLAMDLEFLGRKDLGDYFLDQYGHLVGENSAPPALKDFYLAYVRWSESKVDCIRLTQSHL